MCERKRERNKEKERIQERRVEKSTRGRSHNDRLALLYSTFRLTILSMPLGPRLVRTTSATARVDDV